MRLSRTLAALVALPLALAACGAEDALPAASAPIAADASRAAPEVSADAPHVVVLGDSWAAGYGVEAEAAFPAVAQRLLAREGLPIRLTNGAVSGDTSAGGRESLDWLLELEPDVVVVEIGGNDGLRGLPLDALEENLDAILDGILEAGARPLLLGMRLPTNYSGGYAEEFRAIYERLGAREGVAWLEHFAGPVFDDTDLLQRDGLHPTREGQEELGRELARALAPLVGAREEAGRAGDPEKVEIAR